MQGGLYLGRQKIFFQYPSGKGNVAFVLESKFDRDSQEDL